jgi:hypothetical protein
VFILRNVFFNVLFQIKNIFDRAKFNINFSVILGHLHFIVIKIIKGCVVFLSSGTERIFSNVTHLARILLQILAVRNVMWVYTKCGTKEFGYMTTILWADTQTALVGFEVLTAASMKMTVFWAVASCSLVEIYRRFRGTCGTNRPDDGDSKYL